MVSWIHLSDFHFSKEEHKKWDEQIVLKDLLEDITDRIAFDDLRPDFILVSGDVAFSGSLEEYRSAGLFFDELLKITGLEKKDLVIVPGNHDVNRNAVTFSENAITSSIVDRQTVVQVLDAQGPKRLILSRLDGFRDFLNDYIYSQEVFNDDSFFSFHQFEVSGKRIAIIGLNSAWLSQGGEADRAKIAIGERQVRNGVDFAKNADLKIALVHHPFDWLRDFDRHDCRALLQRNCDFILHGHLHQSELAILRAPGTEAMMIAAGACYETREYRNSYNIVRLDLETGRGQVYLRCYSDAEGGFWTKDVLTYRDVKDGIYPFVLPSRDKRPISSQPKTDAVPVAMDDREIRAYCEKVEALHATLPLAGFSTKLRVSIDVTDLYVPLRAMVDLRGTGDANFADARDAEACLRSRESLELSLPDAFHECEKRKRRSIVILGDGAGKTTHLKRVLLACCRQGPEAIGLPKNMVPVFLPLRDLRDLDSGLDAFIQNQLDKNVHLGTAPNFGRRLLERGHLLFLLDGLDEVSDIEDRKKVSKWLNEAEQIHSTCRFVVTSRFAGYSPDVRLEARFLELHIRPLSDEQRGLIPEIVARYVRLKDEYRQVLAAEEG